MRGERVDQRTLQLIRSHTFPFSISLQCTQQVVKYPKTITTDDHIRRQHQAADTD